MLTTAMPSAMSTMAAKGTLFLHVQILEAVNGTLVTMVRPA